MSLRPGFGHKKQHAFLAAYLAAAGGCQAPERSGVLERSGRSEEASTAVLVYVARSCTSGLDSGSQPQSILAGRKAGLNGFQTIREASPNLVFGVAVTQREESWWGGTQEMIGGGENGAWKK